MINHKQKRIFNYIKGYLLITGDAPTMREIGKEFGMSSSASVHFQLKTLEHEGLIKRSRKHRGIEVVEQEKAA